MGRERGVLSRNCEFLWHNGGYILCLQGNKRIDFAMNHAHHATNSSCSIKVYTSTKHYIIHAFSYLPQATYSAQA